MKTLRAIPMILALIAFCATVQVARAQDGAQPVQVAQAQEATPSGDNRPATLGDIRDLRNETNALGRELRAQIQGIYEQNQLMQMQYQAFYNSLNNALLAIIGVFATMVAGFATLIWKNRSGTPSVSAAVFLIPVALAAALTVGAAIAAVI